MHLKENLHQLIKQHSLNVLKLSKLTGVPKSTISDWMLGNSPKNIQQVKTIANYFNINVDQLVFAEDINGLKYQGKIDELIPFGKFDVYLKKI